MQQASFDSKCKPQNWMYQFDCKRHEMNCYTLVIWHEIMFCFTMFFFVFCTRFNKGDADCVHQHKSMCLTF